MWRMADSARRVDPTAGFFFVLRSGRILDDRAIHAQKSSKSRLFSLCALVDRVVSHSMSLGSEKLCKCDRMW